MGLSPGAARQRRPAIPAFALPDLIDPAGWLRSRLLPLDAVPEPDTRLRPAAVLVPIVERPQGLTILLTLRATSLSKHAGQVAFPGGRVDAEDADRVATALRETEEETGIDRGFVTPLGAIEPVESITGFEMFPIVALVREGFTATANPGEVDAIFEVPFAFLMDADNHRHEQATIKGTVRSYYRIPYDGYDIWGATARILVNLSRRLNAV